MSIKSSFPTDPPSLVLDFANSRRLDPRITFTRAQTGNVASYLGPDGLVKFVGPNAPRFDHRYVARTNLITYSEDFGTAWSSGTVTVTTNQIANPLDGAITADKYVATTALDRHRVQQSIGNEIGIEYTGSLYVKSAGVDTVSLRIGRSSDVDAVVFNILSGTVISEGSSITSSSIENVGNGWFRIIITNTPAIAGTQYFVISEDEKTSEFSGDGVNGFYFWGAQLEKNDTATAYIPTTSVPATESYMESLGLLVEESRANFLLYSKDFSSGWNNNNPSASTAAQIISNTTETLSPDGTNNAAKIIQANDGWQRIAQSIATDNNNTHTWSIFVKYGNSSMCLVEFTGSWNAGGRVQWNFNTETFDTAINFSNLGYEKYANGWYRLYGSWVATSNNGTVGTVWFFPGDDYSGVPTSPASYTYVYGYQVEEGSFPTSYIPTSGSAVTRNADEPTIFNTNGEFDSFYNQSAGSFVAEVEFYKNVRSTSGFFRIYQVSYGGGGGIGNGIYLNNGDANTYFRYRIDDYTGNFAFVDNYYIDQLPAPEYTIMSMAYGADEVAYCGNGEDVVSYYGYSTRTDMNVLFIGKQANTNVMLNGTFKKLIYYPVRVSNAQLQALTK